VIALKLTGRQFVLFGVKQSDPAPPVRGILRRVEFDHPVVVGDGLGEFRQKEQGIAALRVQVQLVRPGGNGRRQSVDLLCQVRLQSAGVTLRLRWIGRGK
jgi:hypothetical protein